MSYLFLIDNPNTEIFLSDKYSVVRIILDWRSRRDSNPCAKLMANAFRVRPVMTTSIQLRIFNQAKT